MGDEIKRWLWEDCVNLFKTSHDDVAVVRCRAWLGAATYYLDEIIARLESLQAGVGQAMPAGEVARMVPQGIAAVRRSLQGTAPGSYLPRHDNDDVQDVPDGVTVALRTLLHETAPLPAAIRAAAAEVREPASLAGESERRLWEYRERGYTAAYKPGEFLQALVDERLHAGTVVVDDDGDFDLVGGRANDRSRFRQDIRWRYHRGQREARDALEALAESYTNVKDRLPTPVKPRVLPDWVTGDSGASTAEAIEAARSTAPLMPTVNSGNPLGGSPFAPSGAVGGGPAGSGGDVGWPGGGGEGGGPPHDWPPGQDRPPWDSPGYTQTAATGGFDPVGTSGGNPGDVMGGAIRKDGVGGVGGRGGASLDRYGNPVYPPPLYPGGAGAADASATGAYQVARREDFAEVAYLDIDDDMPPAGGFA